MDLLSDKGLAVVAHSLGGMDAADEKTIDEIIYTFRRELNIQEMSAEAIKEVHKTIPEDDDSEVCPEFFNELAYNLRSKTKRKIIADRHAQKNITLGEAKREIADIIEKSFNLIRDRVNMIDAMDEAAFEQYSMGYMTGIASKISEDHSKKERNKTRTFLTRNFGPDHYSQLITEDRDMYYMLEKGVKEEGILNFQGAKKLLKEKQKTDKNLIDFILQTPRGNTLPEKAEALAQTLIEITDETYFESEIKNKIREGLAGWLCNIGIMRKARNENYEINSRLVNEIISNDLKKVSIEIDTLKEEREYVFGGSHENCITLNPFQIRKKCIDDYIAYFEENAETEKDKKKAELARKVFSEDAGLIINEYMPFISKNTKIRIRQELGKAAEKEYAPAGNGLERILFDVRKKKIEEIILEEIGIGLQQKPMTEKRKALELVLKKFHPEVYLAPPAPKGEFGYVISATKNAEEVKNAAIATGSSCIRNDPISKFSRDASDYGLIFLVGRDNEGLKGYARMYLMRNENEELVLGIDTIEPPGKDFVRYIGLVHAFSLAAIQLSLEIGAKYVVSRDPRIKYGPREAFGNTERNMKLNKIGKRDVTRCHMPHNHSGDVFVLMQNWRK